MKIKVVAPLPPYCGCFRTTKSRFLENFNQKQKIELITNAELIEYIEQSFKTETFKTKTFKKILIKLFPKEINMADIYIPESFGIAEIDEDWILDYIYM